MALTITLYALALIQFLVQCLAIYITVFIGPITYECTKAFFCFSLVNVFILIVVLIIAASSLDELIEDNKHPFR